MVEVESLLPPCDVVIKLLPSNYGELVALEHRHGIGVHFDGSKTDKGAQNWFQSPDFKLSYNRAYTDAGRRLRLAPMQFAAHHMGRCRRPPLSANVAFYGLCITADIGHTATYEQFAALAYDAAIISRYHRWDVDRVEQWLVGHNEWAIFNERDNPTRPDLWGQLGRKIDPIGTDVQRPVLSLNSLRGAVAALRISPSHSVWANWPAHLP